MAANSDPFNAVGGITVGIPAVPVISANGTLTAVVNSSVVVANTGTFGNLNITGNLTVAPGTTIFGVGNLASATFVGSIAGTTLTVTSISSGVITIGATITGAGVPSGTTVTAQTAGTGGGIGTYTLSIPGAVASTNMIATISVADNLRVPGSDTQLVFNLAGNACTSPNLTFDPVVNFLHVMGNMCVEDTMTANYYWGDGSNLRNVVATTVSVAAQPNITSLGTLANLTVAGPLNITSPANLFVAGGNTGDVLVKSAAGGMQWSLFNPNAISNGSSNVSIATAGGPVTISSGGVANVVRVTPTDVYVNATELLVTGNVAAQYFDGNGARLSGLNAANLIGQVNFALLATTVSGAAQPNITSVGTLTGLTVNGVTNLGANGNVRILGGAPSQVLSTDGSGGLSWISVAVSNAITDGTSAMTVYPSGDITANIAGVSNVLVLSGTQSTLRGHWNPDANNTYDLGNATNQWRDLYLSGNTLYMDGVALTLTTNPVNLSAGNIALSVNGAQVATYSGAANSVLWAPNIGNATSNLYGDGGNISNIQGANVVGAVANAIYSDNSGNAANAVNVTGAAQPNITSVGTLTSLGVTGNITTGNISSLGAVTAAGNVTGANGVFTNIQGTLTTAAQPGITSVGSLLSLNVSGNIVGGNVYANFGAVQGAAAVFTTVAGGIVTPSQPNITTIGALTNLSVVGNATFGNISIPNGTINANVVTGNYFSVDNSRFIGNILPSANVTYNLGNNFFRWNDLWLSGTSIYLGGATITNPLNDTVAVPNLQVTGGFVGDFLPTSNLTANLGSPTRRWKDVYLSNNSLYLGFAHVTSYGPISSPTVKVPGLEVTGFVQGNLVPAANGTFVIGRPDSQWQLIGAGSLQVGNTIITTDPATGGLLAGGNSVTTTTPNGTTTSNSFIAANSITTNTLNANTANIIDLNATGDLDVAGNVYSNGGVYANSDSFFGQDVTVGGNLTVTGNLTYTDINTLSVTDPIIDLGGGPNGTPLTSNDGRDRGLEILYYTTQPVSAFSGWKNSTGEFIFGSNVTVANNIVTVNTWGNVRAGVYFGDGGGLSNIVAGNVVGTVANSDHSWFSNVANYANYVAAGNVVGVVANAAYAVFAGTANIANGVDGGNVIGTVANANYSAFAEKVIDGAQPNITSVGTLNGLTVNGLTNLGSVLDVKITGGLAGQYLRTDGTGNLSWGNIDTGNITANNANYANVANVANVAYSVDVANVAGIGNIATINLNGNVSQVLSGDGSWITISGDGNNANYANFANVANTANTALSVTGGNVIGEVANANFAVYSTIANSALSVAGANVSGEVANANYASYAGTAWSVSGSNVTGEVANANYATVAGSALSVSGSNVVGAVANALHADTADTVSANAQPNITSVGTLTALTVSGQLQGADATFTGNLTVQGNTIYTNVTDLYVVDPIIQLGGGPNGAPLTSNDGRDRGTYLHVYDTAANAEVNKFSGWKTSTGEFVFASNATIANDVITVNEYGTVRAGAFIGDGSQLSNLNVGNASVATANTANTANTALSVAGANVTGEVANANYAHFAGTAWSITGSNVTGEVANANYSQFAGTAAIANSVTGANVSGEVANANFATYSSTANTANNAAVASALNTDISNTTITGGSNGQLLSTDGTGNLQFVAPYTLSVGNLSASNGNAFITTYSNVTTLGFDEDSGFSVDDLGNGTVKIAINSTFKFWEVNGNTGLIAEGLDTVNFIAGNGVTLEANNDSSPKTFTISMAGGAGGTPAGNTTEIQFNAGGGLFGASPELSFNAASGLLSVSNTVSGATGIVLGNPNAGNLISSALSLTNSTSVTNSIALINQILGKLVPPQPPTFPGTSSFSISSLSTYRMANFTQTDNTPGANKNVAGGTVVSTVRRANTYNANVITTVGPGDTGTVVAYLNGAAAGSRTLTANLNGNGTYSNLVIFNNYDYNSANSSIAPGFWSVLSARAAGVVTQGWNEVYISHSAAGNTSRPAWYYDASAPGTPQFSNVSFTQPVSANVTYSSTVPHYDNTVQFTLQFSVNRLSGDMYPVSDTFATGTAGGAFSTPASRTYAAANITTPLARNLYVSSGAADVTTTATVISGFGSSAAGPSVSVTNSYNTGTQSFTPAGTVLYKTGTNNSMEETNIRFGSTVGVGSGSAYRIINPGSSDTPAYTGSEAAFNSQSSTLETYDATLVGAVLRHDVTDYSTYLPAGPDLSSGRSGAQYFTFKFVRSSVSKFDIKWSGTIAGLWVALPGSVIDNTSNLDGWLDLSTAYGGAGIPGGDIASGGNGSDGAALGTPAPLNSAQTNRAITATFGTVSSSSTATNEIYVRIKLTSGQTVTALSLETASN